MKIGQHLLNLFKTAQNPLKIDQNPQNLHFFCIVLLFTVRIFRLRKTSKIHQNIRKALKIYQIKLRGHVTL